MGINFDVNGNEKVEKIVDSAKAPIKVEINLTELTRLFSRAEKAIDAMVEKAENHSVTGLDSRESAIEMGTQAKQLFNKIEKKRKEIKEPFLKYSQKLDGMVKPLKDKLSSIQSGLKIKIKYHIDAENKRKADAERKRLEVEAALNPESKLPEPVTQNSKPVIESVQRTSSGSATVKKVWKFKVKDLQKVPSKYLMLNEDAVQTSIDLGIRDIPGIEIYEDSDIRLTVSRKGGPLNG